MSATADDVLSGLDDVIDAPDLPEVKVDITPPADKDPPARAEDGKFKGKEGEADPKAKETKEPAKIVDGEPKTVPLASHLEERNRHKAEVEQERAARRALEERLAKLENPPKSPPAAPDHATNPTGYIDHRVNEALQKLEGKVTETGKTAEQAQQEAAFTRFQHTLATSEQQFMQATPDYYDALGHLRTLRANELITLNPDLTQPQLIEMIQREELGLASQLLRSGRNPHEVAYSLAKARGYAPKAPNGAAGESLLPEVKGQKQLPPDQTLGSSSGSPNAGENFMNDDEVFDKAFNEMFPKRKRA